MTSLVVSRDEAKQKIEAQIQLGRDIENRAIQWDDLTAAQNERDRWSASSRELLRSLFSDESFAADYGKSFLSGMRYPDFQSRVQGFHDGVTRSLAVLQAILDQLDSITEALPLQTQEGQAAAAPKSVFIVCGDDQAAEGLVRFVEKLKLSAILFQEEANSAAVVEKFVREAAGVRFALVVTSEDADTQARQQVIFELGYFVGKLGRGKVCLFTKGKSAIPADLAGVVVVSLDSGGWQVQLARAMSAAGLEVAFGQAL